MNSQTYVSPNYSRMYSSPLTPNFQVRRLVLPKVLDSFIKLEKLLLILVNLSVYLMK
jgi:hypothetical protein